VPWGGPWRDLQFPFRLNKPVGNRGVPLDKEKGFVKDEDILSGAEHRFWSFYIFRAREWGGGP
jgi:hypothetical protein